MARPLKCRNVRFFPDVTYYKPRGIPLRQLPENVMTTDEIEAIRLADLEGMYQEKAAAEMKISRQTFSNILKSAHRKLADAIVHGKAIKIEEGVVQMQRFVCSKCENEWRNPRINENPDVCPNCRAEY